MKFDWLSQNQIEGMSNCSASYFHEGSLNIKAMTAWKVFSYWLILFLTFRDRISRLSHDVEGVQCCDLWPIRHKLSLYRRKVCSSLNLWLQHLLSDASEENRWAFLNILNGRRVLFWSTLDKTWLWRLYRDNVTTKISWFTQPLAEKPRPTADQVN